MKRLVPVIIIVLLACQSCIYKKINHFTSDEVEWLGDFRGRGLTEFKSKTGLIDTMRILNITLHNSLNPFYISCTLLDIYYPTGHVFFDIMGTDITCGYFMIYDDDRIDYTFHEYLKARNGVIKPTISNKRNMKIGGRIYKECQVMDFDNSEIPDSVRSLKQCVWAKGIGLVYYKTNDNQEFFFKGSAYKKRRK